MVYDSLKAFKSNLRQRIKFLGVTLTEASRIAKHNKGWLIDITQQYRYKQRLGTDIIDEISMLVGVPPWEMIRPDSDISIEKWEQPQWIIDPDYYYYGQINFNYISGPTALINIEKRLIYLDVDTGFVSVSLGYQKRWLYLLLTRDRKNGRIGTNVLDGLAIYFASPPWALIHEDYDPRDYTEPNWLSIIRSRQRRNGKNYRRLNL